MPTKKSDTKTTEEKVVRKRAATKKQTGASEASAEHNKKEEVIDTEINNESLREAPSVSGKRFVYHNIEFIALDIVGDGVLAISAEILSDKMRFADNDEVGSNDWRKSSIRKKLNGDFLSKFSQIDLIPIVSDLTADTGEDNYGICEDYIALPSDVILRKYNKIIPEYPTWIWSITPWAINYSTMSAVSARTQNKTIYSEKPNRELGVAIVCIFKRDAINL